MDNTHVVEINEDAALGALVFEELLGKLVQTLQFVLSLPDDPLKGTKVTGGGTLVQEIDIEMFGNRVLASSDGLENGTLTATVLAEETVSSAVRKFEGGIGNEDTTVEDERGTGDLDVLAGGSRGQDTGGDSIGDAVLVHLLSQALDLVGLCASGSKGIFADDDIAVNIKFNFLLLLQILGSLGSLELSLGGLLCEALLLG